MKANIMKPKILVLLLIEISLIGLFSASAVFAREELQEGSVGTTPGNMTAVIEDIIEDYNANLAGMPWIVKSVMGTETIRAKITFKDGTSHIVGLKTKDGLIVEHQLGPYPGSTMALYLSEDVVEKIKAAEDPFVALKAAWGKEIRYKGLTFSKKVKVGFINIGFKLYAFFHSLLKPAAPPVIVKMPVAKLELSATSPHIADGKDASTVTIKAFDAQGKSLAGRHIIVTAFAGLDAMKGFAAADNGDGTYTALVPSRYADEVLLVAADVKTGLTAHTNVTFTPTGEKIEIKVPAINITNVTKPPKPVCLKIWYVEGMVAEEKEQELKEMITEDVEKAKKIFAEHVPICCPNFVWTLKWNEIPKDTWAKIDKDGDGLDIPVESLIAETVDNQTLSAEEVELVKNREPNCINVWYILRYEIKRVAGRGFNPVGAGQNQSGVVVVAGVPDIVLAHELGHFFSLDHEIGDEFNLMYWKYSDKMSKLTPEQCEKITEADP